MTFPQQPPSLPVSNKTVQDLYNWLFAPWVKDLGLRDFDVSPGRARATLPQNSKLQFASGAVCGQAIMSAVDTVAAIAMATTEKQPKGTVYQHTHFLRPAVSEDMSVEVHVLRFGKTTAFAEAKVCFVSAGDLVAHVSIEFAF